MGQGRGLTLRIESGLPTAGRLARAARRGHDAPRGQAVLPRLSAQVERWLAVPMHVTVLSAAAAPQYRELMLEAYLQAADAFTSTAEEREAEPPSWWVDRIASPSGLSQAFGAYQGQELVGAVALEFSAKPETRHSALVVGMYVKPAARRVGAGVLLVQAAIAAARARPELLLLRLTVTEGNLQAIRLYESVGFSAWGIEPLAICTPSGYKGKVHMSLQLRGTQTAA